MQITKSQSDKSPLNQCVRNAIEMLEVVHKREVLESKNHRTNEQIHNIAQETLPKQAGSSEPLSLLSGACTSHTGLCCILKHKLLPTPGPFAGSFLNMKGSLVPFH